MCSKTSSAKRSFHIVPQAFPSHAIRSGLSISLSKKDFRSTRASHPVYHDRYGIPDADPEIHSIDTPAGSVWEFPVAVHQVGRWNLPISGGGYFRLYPLRMTLHCLADINQRKQRPFVFYLHPWEVDPDQPRLPIRSRMSRMRHYVGLRSTLNKFETLIDRFKFSTLREVVENQSQHNGHAA